jgi:hypothetical protein
MCWTAYGIPSELTAEVDIPILKVGLLLQEACPIGILL